MDGVVKAIAQQEHKLIPGHVHLAAKPVGHQQRDHVLRVHLVDGEGNTHGFVCFPELFGKGIHEGALLQNRYADKAGLNSEKRFSFLI
jgi:hypothetical protein